MANDAGFLLGGEFSLGGSKFVRVQATRFGKNWRTCLGEQMVADGMTRWRSCKTVRGQNIRELKEQEWTGEMLEKKMWETCVDDRENQLRG